MKKLHKLAAAVAVAAGIALSPQAGAIGYNTVGMEQETGGRGDALLFPVFYGHGENFFTISNTTDKFIQGHLRFRGAAWSGELLDFDVVLTPGDVFVFRLADIDGDGFWEIDQSLDPNNFAYTGILQSCIPEGGQGVGKGNCIDQYTDLIPLANNTPADGSCGITPGLITHHRNLGYVEFIGEGVFNGLTHEILNNLIKPENAGKLENQGQREIANLLGTSLWSWVMPTGVNQDGGAGSDMANNKLGTFHATRTASDVPNALSGTAFITPVGKPYGVAYNAEALINFRTNNYPHRVDTYPTTGVIVHTENAGAVPAGSFLYLYGYNEAGSSNVAQRVYESRISFNNTWGPTLADGDDYGGIDPGIATDDIGNLDGSRVTITPNALGLGYLRAMGGSDADQFDFPNFPVNTSIAEVEETIRKATYYNAPVSQVTVPNQNSPRQTFTGFYFDNAVFDKACQGNGRQDNPSCSNTTLQSWYFAFFPTKFYYAESGVHWIDAANPAQCGINKTNKLLGKKGYLEAGVEHALALAKPFNVEVWDITEKTPGNVCVQSPCIIESQALPLAQELSFFSIKDIKSRFGNSSNHQSWDAGRVVLKVSPEANVCREPVASQGPLCINTFPGLLYTFEMASDGGLAHWRALER